MGVQGFDSLDGMFAAMGEMEDAANARLTPVQVALRDATEQRVYWARAIPDWDLVIYGEVPPNAETQEGADFDVDENRGRGYLTGTAYSAATGEHGEPGDTHVSEVIAISDETFRLARDLGFPDWNQIREPDNFALATRLALHERANR